MHSSRMRSHTDDTSFGVRQSCCRFAQRTQWHRRYIRRTASNQSPPAALPTPTARARRLFVSPPQFPTTKSPAPLRRATPAPAIAHTSSTPARTRRCARAARGNADSRRSDPRCSCTPLPIRTAKTRRLVSAQRILPAPAAGFSFVRSCPVSYYTGAGEDHMKAKLPKTNPAQALVGKPVSASRSEMAEVVLPAQTNPLGKLLGGHVMHLVDIAAAMAAHRHSNSYVVTASVDSIDFRNPISLGEIVILKSQVNRAFHTSMEVGVEVYSENVLTGERKHTTSAYVTFVAIDEKTHRPKPVRPLLVKTAEEKRRYEEAAGRRKTRLALRYRENERTAS